MVKLSINYENTQERDRLIEELKQKFKILKISKEYKNEGPYKRVYINLK